jgi:methyl-accepting chemotaxis protein
MELKFPQFYKNILDLKQLINLIDMKKTLYFLPIGLLLLLLISCSGKNIEKQVVKIDSLEKIMGTLAQELKEINKDTIENRYQTFKRTSDTLAKHLKELRNDESWKYICAYQNVNEPFESMASKYYQYKSQIDSSLKQLADLKHDVKAKLLSNKEFDNYFKNESESVNTLIEKVGEEIEITVSQMKNYDTVHPYLIKLISDHKSGKKTTK